MHFIVVFFMLDFIFVFILLFLEFNFALKALKLCTKFNAYCRCSQSKCILWNAFCENGA